MAPAYCSNNVMIMGEQIIYTHKQKNSHDEDFRRIKHFMDNKMFEFVCYLHQNYWLKERKIGYVFDRGQNRQQTHVVNGILKLIND